MAEVLGLFGVPLPVDAVRTATLRAIVPSKPLPLAT
jgi:hypothetical protein